jgi:hypothetical protein
LDVGLRAAHPTLPPALVLYAQWLLFAYCRVVVSNVREALDVILAVGREGCEKAFHVLVIRQFPHRHHLWVLTPPGRGLRVFFALGLVLAGS